MEDEIFIFILTKLRNKVGFIIVHTLNVSMTLLFFRTGHSSSAVGLVNNSLTLFFQNISELCCSKLSAFVILVHERVVNLLIDVTDWLLLMNGRFTLSNSGPMTINCKSKFQSSISFAVVLLMNLNFKDLFQSTVCSHLQIIKTVCPIKFEIFKV